MVKLKFQYFGHLMGRADSLEKTLILGRTEGKRRRGQQRMPPKKMGYPGSPETQEPTECADGRQRGIKVSEWGQGSPQVTE